MYSVYGYVEGEKEKNSLELFVWNIFIIFLSYHTMKCIELAYTYIKVIFKLYHTQTNSHTD